MPIIETTINTIKRMLGVVAPNGKARIKILVVGDSNSCQPAGYQAILAQNPYFSVTVAAQPGKKTDWALQQVMAKVKPNAFNWVIINIGINDIYTASPNGAIIAQQNALKNIEKMVKWCTNASAKVILIDGVNQALRTVPNDPKQNQAYNALKNSIISNQKATYSVSMAKFMHTYAQACEDKYCHAKVDVHKQVAATIKPLILYN
jgi:lysophospholipase L1-like esterase